MSTPTSRTVFIAGLVVISPAPVATSAGILRAEFVLQDDGAGGRDIIRRGGAKNNQVDVLGPASGAFERLLGGHQSEVRRHPVIWHIEALADAGAGGELVNDMRPSQRREPLRQFGIADEVRRQIASGRDNLSDASHAGTCQGGGWEF